jgi:hypothetical protein
MMAERQIEADSGVKKRLVKSMIIFTAIILYFLFCSYLPTMAGDTRNPNCDFNASGANNMFAYVVVGTLLAMTILELCVYAYRKRTQPSYAFMEGLQQFELVSLLANGSV